MFWFHYLGIYLAGVLIFIIWDTLIGWGGYEFGDYFEDDKPPVWVGALFWMISFPILLLSLLCAKTNNLRKERQRRQQECKEKEQKEEDRKRRLRIKEEEDLRAIEEELDKEQFKNKR